MSDVVTAYFNLNGLNLISGDAYSINGTDVLTATTIGSASTVLGSGALAGDQTWIGSQRGNVAVLTDGATITPDFDEGNNFKLTLGGNRTMANATNLVAGQAGHITISQDGTGSRTLAFESKWKFIGGTAPTLTTTADANDRLSYYVASTDHIHAAMGLDVK